MTFQVLLATMNQHDDSVLNKMRVLSDVLVCNQIDNEFCYHKYLKDGYSVRWYDFSERGVGLNRNNALMRAEADICLIADDDVEYCANYKEIIVQEFKKHPEADMILFNVENYGYKTKKFKRIRQFNCGRFGGVRIAFKRLSIVKNAICFNLLFGGGARFSAGEDNMFIRDAIRKGLKVYASPTTILRLNDSRESTWFKGYTDKFFSDLGTSYCFHYGIFAKICVVIQLIRHRKEFLQETTFKSAYRSALNGIKIYRNL